MHFDQCSCESLPVLPVQTPKGEGARRIENEDEEQAGARPRFRGRRAEDHLCPCGEGIRGGLQAEDQEQDAERKGRRGRRLQAGVRSR